MKSAGWLYALFAVVRELVSVVWIKMFANQLLGYRIGPKLNYNAAKNFLPKTLVVGCAAALYNIYFYMGAFIIWAFLSLDELGAYTAAFRPINPLLIIPWLLMIPLLPIITRMARNNSEQFRCHIYFSTAFAIGIGALIAVLGWLLKKDIILLLYGGNYLTGPLASAQVFGLLCAAMGFSFATAVIVTHMLSDGREKMILRMAMVGFALNIVLMLVLLPAIGFMAAGISALVAEVVVCVYGIYYVIKAFSIDLGIFLLHLAVNLVPAISVVFLFPQDIDGTLLKFLVGSVMGTVGLLILFMLPSARQGRRIIDGNRLTSSNEQ